MNKKLIPFIAIALSLASCGKSTANSDTNSQSTVPPVTSISTTIDINSRGSVSSWSELKPYLQFALEDYYSELPAFDVHSYNVSFQESNDVLGVLIDCLELRGANGEDTYAAILANAGFSVRLDGEVPYAYKMVSDFDCEYVQFLQDGSTLSILAYYQTVRVAEWPTELSDLIVSPDMPKLKADAYAYTYNVNARNFITFYIDCYFKDGSTSLSTYLKTLTKANYSITNQSGYYTAISDDGEIVINFDDYYGDGTCIEIAAYSAWPGLDFAYYFGFDLPRYEGISSGFETQYMDLDSGSYICVFYDGVESLCLSVYGEQLKKIGLTFDPDSSTSNSHIYYLNDPKLSYEEQPWVQVTYNSERHSMLIAIPYTYPTYEE